jgi:hypothetical protein
MSFLWDSGICLRAGKAKNPGLAVRSGFFLAQQAALAANNWRSLALGSQRWDRTSRDDYAPTAGPRC